MEEIAAGRYIISRWYEICARSNKGFIFFHPFRSSWSFLFEVGKNLSTYSFEERMKLQIRKFKLDLAAIDSQ